MATGKQETEPQRLSREAGEAKRREEEEMDAEANVSAARAERERRLQEARARRAQGGRAPDEPVASREQIDAVKREYQLHGQQISDEQAMIIVRHQELYPEPRAMNPVVMVVPADAPVSRIMAALRPNGEHDEPMDETVPGGRYIVGGEVVDAMGRRLQD
jgi:hypothetical protein